MRHCGWRRARWLYLRFQFADEPAYHLGARPDARAEAAARVSGPQANSGDGPDLWTARPWSDCAGLSRRPECYRLREAESRAACRGARFAGGREADRAARERLPAHVRA